jgi:hypothetical protein
MNREEQIKMWEMAAGKMGREEKGETKPPVRQWTPEEIAARRAQEALRGQHKHQMGTAAVHGSSAEAAALRKKLGFGK